MKKGIIGTLFVEYDVDAEIQEHMAPASLMPSWRIWPFLSSL